MEVPFSAIHKVDALEDGSRDDRLPHCAIRYSDLLIRFAMLIDLRRRFTNFQNFIFLNFS